jgi:para-nitrobenzyl esterase
MLGLLLLCVLASAQAQGPVWQTALGPVEGYTDPATQVSVFLGIPYAQPPVGPLRWKSPLIHE